MKTPGLLALLSLVLVSSAAAQDAPPLPPPPEPAPAPALLYLGLNRQGAEEWWRAKDGAVVIRVPGGPYRSRPYEGATAVEPPKAVPVASFFMDRCEVTNGQFARLLQETGAAVDAAFVRREIPGLVFEGGAWRAAPGLERHPATACTGVGALEYAKWAGARIPGAHEWMKAAGGAEGRLYPWGDAEPDESRANFGRPARRGLEPVGSHPLGASPYGCLDMAGNAYDRVMARAGRGRAGEEPVRGAPVMLKGGSWVSAHPLNLRVLDLCMQPAEVADASVGFRCAMDDPDPDRKPRTAEERPVLRLAKDFDAAVAEAKSRKVPIFLSLLHDTCGQCDRTIAQCYRDPRFVKYCNENMVVVLGHQPWDAGDRPHAARADGSCTVHPGLACREHEELYRRGLAVVGGFQTSPGNFVLDPSRTEKGAGAKAVLVEERALPKWGDAVDAYLQAFDRARAAMTAR
jgi:formylglycine-generating enzyme required for sulfatase activity